MDIREMIDEDTIESLRHSIQVENVKSLHPAFRFQLDRTLKRRRLFQNTLNALEDI